MLPKAPSAIISSTLFALPGYFLYTNFDPDNYSPLLSKIRGVGIFVSNNLNSSQVFMQTTTLKNQMGKNDPKFVVILPAIQTTHKLGSNNPTI